MLRFSVFHNQRLLPSVAWVLSGVLHLSVVAWMLCSQAGEIHQPISTLPTRVYIISRSYDNHLSRGHARKISSPFLALQGRPLPRNPERGERRQSDIGQNLPLGSRPARLVGEVGDIYTSTARDLGVEGSILAQIEVDRTGRAKKVQLLTRLGYGLDERVLAFLKSAQFEAARDGNGHFQEDTIKHEIVFELSGSQ